jgi:hypothetical protein
MPSFAAFIRAQKGLTLEDNLNFVDRILLRLARSEKLKWAQCESSFATSPAEDTGCRIEAPTSFALEVHAPAGLRADDGDMLLTGPVLWVLEQVGSELRLFLLQSLDLTPNIKQAIYRMSVLN